MSKVDTKLVELNFEITGSEDVMMNEEVIKAVYKIQTFADQTLKSTGLISSVFGKIDCFGATDEYLARKFRELGHSNESSILH